VPVRSRNKHQKLIKLKKSERESREEPGKESFTTEDSSISFSELVVKEEVQTSMLVKKKNQCANKPNYGCHFEKHLHNLSLTLVFASVFMEMGVSSLVW